MTTENNEKAVTGVLVTSENLAQFNAKKLGLAETTAPTEAEIKTPEPEPVAKSEQESEAGGESVTEQEDEKEGQKEKSSAPKIERRFSELTKQRELAKEEARKEREAREVLESRVKELEAKVNPPEKKVDVTLEPEPRPEQFSDMYEYAKALAEYTADKKLAERDKAEQIKKEAMEQQAKYKSWADRIESSKAELPDFEDKVRSSDVIVSDAVKESIIESPFGPKLLYHLAEHPEVAKKLSEMSPISAAREIGKIEASFEKPAEKSPTVTKTKAPAPISPLKGAVGTAENHMDEKGNFVGTYQQWKALRSANKIR